MQDASRLLAKTQPEGPSTLCLRTLVPKTIPLMTFGTRALKCWVLGPSGTGISTDKISITKASALTKFKLCFLHHGCKGKASINVQGPGVES